MPRKKLLITDDFRRLAEDYRGVIERGGIEVFTATTAEEALAVHRAETVDFILADINLPKMGGDRLCAEIRKDKALQRVYVTLVCSGKKAEIKRCGDAGANNYLKRPVNPAEVMDRIVRVLDVNARRAERVLVKVSVHSVYNNETFFCTSRDISATGILLETDKVLARGDKMACSFFLPDSARVHTEGRVVRVAKAPEEVVNAYGVEFVAVDGEAKKSIDEFVRNRLVDIGGG